MAIAMAMMIVMQTVLKTKIVYWDDCNKAIAGHSITMKQQDNKDNNDNCDDDNDNDDNKDAKDDSISLCVLSKSAQGRWFTVSDSLILTNYAWKQWGQKSFEFQILIFEQGGQLRFHNAQKIIIFF